MSLIGTHCILELFDCPAEGLDDEAAILRALALAAEAAGATLLTHTARRFEPHGVTAVALLAESHIAIHTWPELGYAAADVFTCGPTCDPRAACAALAEALGAARADRRDLDRGVAGHAPPTREPLPRA